MKEQRSSWNISIKSQFSALTTECLLTYMEEKKSFMFEELTEFQVV